MGPIRVYSRLDRLIIGLDEVLQEHGAKKTAGSRPNPADSVAEAGLTPDQRAHSAGLMRVNHAGEVSAQALYQGQALTARDASIRQSMQTAAGEEIDHLHWCSQRLEQLGSRTSYLNPLWYAGSLSIGVAAGLAGDRWSLGFIAETEHQVVRHLDYHLAALPPGDAKSRAILQQMRSDELHHATTAVESGAAVLPMPIRRLMRLCSLVMTKTAYWI